MKQYERPLITKLHTGVTNKFGANPTITPISHIDGVAIEKIMEDWGSPCFVISEKRILSTYRSAVQAFKTRYPKVQFAWSYKTNYLNAVCNTFHSEGSWAEVVSMFEFQKALKNGVSGNKIIYNGPSKTKEDLRIAVEHKAFIHIDNLDELYVLVELLQEMNAKAKVAIRVNMDTGVHPTWERFGFNFENGSAASAIEKIFQYPELDLVGLHTHIGTFMLKVDAYGVAAKKLCDLALMVRDKYGKNLDYIDVGGGFASANTLKGAYLQGVDITPTIDDYAEVITGTLLGAGFHPTKLPTLFLETGRALIDDAGSLVGTVLSTKRLNDGRSATTVDFGVNLLFTSFWYDHKIAPVKDHGSHTESTTLYGPLCMNIDVIRESVVLPYLRRGDQLVVQRVGAYNMTQWMQFIQMRPNIVMICENGEVKLVRAKEDVDTINQMER